MLGTATKATFFAVGSRLREYASVMTSAYSAGHQIALHSWSHGDFTTMSEGTVHS